MGLTAKGIPKEADSGEVSQLVQGHSGRTSSQVVSQELVQGERPGHGGEEETDQKLRVRTEGGAGRTVERRGPSLGALLTER